MSKGVRIDSGVTAPCEIEVLGYDKEKNKTKVRMTLHEGKNREIRKMMAAFHYPVFGLKRVQYSFLTLSGVSRGEYRRLSLEEVKRSPSSEPVWRDFCPLSRQRTGEPRSCSLKKCRRSA